MRKFIVSLLAISTGVVFTSCAGYVAEVARLPGRYEYEAPAGYCYNLERHYHPVQPCCVKGKAELRIASPAVCACAGARHEEHRIKTEVERSRVYSRQESDAARAGRAGQDYYGAGK